ncbi:MULTISPECIES: flavin reductase family protein [unclassified Modestobacter]|uniref:flavin reductase family protein n=1 Tax=unclassified Modestobacter TaxID=2643866 RepID=UPI0022AA35AE|nr:MULTISPECIES: flavin reductase family protein [unclassified Modestobacter]MCZ2811975.1 flavin reductase family protein [Modestobacter sp. VKM Ac-2979]MCZ2843699.1 flavin reductase family protein [Modestobacter sp. VKM Ac-2980]MCZ2849878.1 flavin reductase family protein [Modestobacter sp. VKM Ac-2978]
MAMSARGVESTGVKPNAAELVTAIKGTHRAFPTGVTVVTTIVGGEPVGLAVNAFSSVSLDPPLVMVCVSSTSRTHPHLFVDNPVAINILAAHQESVAMLFAMSEGDKFADLDWHAGQTGAPLVDGAAAAFEGRVISRIPAGTHTIFIVEVVAAGAEPRQAPLLYFGGKFFDPTSLLADD